MSDRQEDVFRDNLAQIPQDEAERELSEHPDIAENEGTTEDVSAQLREEFEQARLNNLNRSP
jgi:hypothetical protein